MTNNISSLKEEAKKVIEHTKGEVRIATIQTHFQYIKEKKGEEGVKKVLEKLKELGYPIDLLELQKQGPLEWIPTGLGDLVILVAKEVFGWTDKDIFDMGNSAPKYSFIVRMLMKTFLSITKVFKESPKYWEKHFTSGKLETIEINEKEKYLILHLKHWCHPLMCIFYSGYFVRIGQYTLKGKVTIEETKCMSKGDPYHEFIIRWE